MHKVMATSALLAGLIFSQGIGAGQSGSNELYKEYYPPSSAKAAQLVDINRAKAADLAKLPGMTEVWADRVVKFRPYIRKTDLLENGILPDRVYDKMKDFVIAHRMD